MKRIISYIVFIILLTICSGFEDALANDFMNMYKSTASPKIIHKINTSVAPKVEIISEKTTVDKKKAVVAGSLIFGSAAVTYFSLLATEEELSALGIKWSGGNIESVRFWPGHCPGEGFTMGCVVYNGATEPGDLVTDMLIGVIMPKIIAGGGLLFLSTHRDFARTWPGIALRGVILGALIKGIGNDVFGPDEFRHFQKVTGINQWWIRGPSIGLDIGGVVLNIWQGYNDIKMKVAIEKKIGNTTIKIRPAISKKMLGARFEIRW